MATQPVATPGKLSGEQIKALSCFVVAAQPASLLLHGAHPMDKRAGSLGRASVQHERADDACSGPGRRFED